MAQLFGLGMKRLDTFAGQVATLPHSTPWLREFRHRSLPEPMGSFSHLRLLRDVSPIEKR